MQQICESKKLNVRQKFTILQYCILVQVIWYNQTSANILLENDYAQSHAYAAEERSRNNINVHNYTVQKYNKMSAIAK